MKDEDEDAQTIDACITKYALTNGIEVRRVKLVGDGMASHGWTYFHPGDWHTDRAAAIAKAEEMRKRKIASLEKQLARLEVLRFS